MNVRAVGWGLTFKSVNFIFNEISTRLTPYFVPCGWVFEPNGKSGRLLVSLGFSVQAEHAHQNQRRFPLKWVLGQRTSSNHIHCRGLIKFEKNQSNFNNSKLRPEDVSRFLNVNIGVKFGIRRIESTSYRYNKKNK